MAEECIGVAVECAVCGRRKKPVGRSAPPGMANGLCDHECPGYQEPPWTTPLWPGESCLNYGYLDCGHVRAEEAENGE